MNNLVRFTYVADKRNNPHIKSTATALPLWTLVQMREGIDYIIGTHDASSEEAQALLAAHRLVESAK